MLTLPKWTLTPALLWTAPSRLVEAFRRSLNPVTETDARDIEAQLVLVHANLKILNYAFPFVGAALVWVHGSRVPFVQMVSALVFVVLACGINEYFLLRQELQEQDFVGKTRTRARIHALATWQLMAWWGWFALTMWAPPGGDLFALLILSCSLAVVATMFAPHAAIAMGAFLAISLPIVVLEFLNSYNMSSPLLLLAILYIVLMAVQSVTIHTRFDKARHLEREREALIEQLRTAHEDALQASKAKSEFLANMSHELRTPLNAIIGFSDIVRNKTFGEQADRYSEYGGYINQSGHHLLTLIGDILDLATIESGKKILHPEPIDLRSLIEDLVHLASEKAEAKRVDVHAHFPSRVPLLMADLRAVRKIFDSLISNAVKFTPEDGRAEVSVVVNALGQIEVAISDTGVGIAPEDQQHFFNRFGKTQAHITTAQRGSGLGLPIIKGLVDMHGGWIKLTSTLGQGTSIGVVFPAERTVQSQALQVA